MPASSPRLLCPCFLTRGGGLAGALEEHPHGAVVFKAPDSWRPSNRAVACRGVSVTHMGPDASATPFRAL